MDTILIIRHAEKPDGTNGGVTEQGTIDSKSLIPRGWQRAGAWTAFFASSNGLLKPDRIYASAVGKEKIAPGEKVGSHSARPIQTVTPLGKRIGAVPLQTFAKGEEQALANAVANLAGITLICWQHEKIPDIASLIKGSSDGIPQSWDPTRFDAIWKLTRAAANAPWTFDQVCPCLLANDSPNRMQ